ncbi:molybdopterin oxidoreductase family protein [Caminibacter pacificus]
MISVCTYCGVGCEIDAEIKDGKIVKIHQVKNGKSSGGELCIKGRYGYEFLNKRLQKHLISYDFIKREAENMPFFLQVRLANLYEYDERFYEAPFSLAADIAAWKIKDIINKYGNRSIAGIGGARTNLESAYLFQKFIRNTLKSPHVDNCARVCHSPSLSGLKMSIGEGASSVSFDEIFNAEAIMIIGSNTTQAHPMVASRIIKAKKRGLKIIVVDVREIPIMKFADISVILPFESNLLFVNAIAKEILKNSLQNDEFIKNRCVKFEEYKELILKDKYDKHFFEKLKGFEHIKSQIEEISKIITSHKTIFAWGLGVTEHIDGTESVNAISNLAMMSGNIGKSGAGVLPLRGQNNVQGACDVGCLPYYLPDYVRPPEDFVGLMTPDIIEAVLEDKIKAIINMGEDILHIHPNQNKIAKAFEKLEFLAVMEVMDNEITKKADIVFAVKSAYEKTGVYVNAERRCHLSTPLVDSNLPDDWEVIKHIENRIKGDYDYKSTEDIFNEICATTGRFRGGSYEMLRNFPKPWPLSEESEILHKEKFSTPDGKGHFHYHKYHVRGEVKDLLEGKRKWYLNTGRELAQYNNAAQTKHSEKLLKKYDDDILLVNEIHKEQIGDKVVLKSVYGESKPLKVKFTKSVRPFTLFTTFHFAKNHINYLFGDEADHKVKTARFKSVEVEVINVTPAK